MARKIVNTKKISHEEWLELRKKSIGGSDSAKMIRRKPLKDSSHGQDCSLSVS